MPPATPIASIITGDASCSSTVLYFFITHTSDKYQAQKYSLLTPLIELVDGVLHSQRAEQSLGPGAKPVVTQQQVTSTIITKEKKWHGLGVVTAYMFYSLDTQENTAIQTVSFLDIFVHKRRQERRQGERRAGPPTTVWTAVS